jgi:hypothetical protein
MALRKLDMYARLKKAAPACPPFTCPHIDDTIASLEKLRAMNDDLRSNVAYWKDSCEEMQMIIDELEAWKKEIQKIVREH